MTEQGTKQEVTVTVEAPTAEEPPARRSRRQATSRPPRRRRCRTNRRRRCAAATGRPRSHSRSGALARLQGTGDIYEGYANYNVGRSLIELGNCEAGLPYIDRSEQIQGSRPEFDQARAKC